MNAKQAKEIKLVHLLGCMNFEPKKAIKNDYWYISPLHNEKTASFKIDNIKNVWYDHAVGLGGNIIDFVSKYFNCDFKTALSHISSITNNNDTARVYMSNYIKTNHDPTDGAITTPIHTKMTVLKKVKELENKVLIEYLESRKIPYSTAKKEILEIYWLNKHTNKSNFGIALKNDSNGYEIRNKHIKLNIGGKDITTIKGIDNSKLSVFEGFIDYLTALVYFDLDRFDGDVIILNSTSLIGRIEDILKKYKKVFCFLDRDYRGVQSLNKIYMINNNVIDCSVYYTSYKDFNEMLLDAPTKR
ncbi:MAG TPA: hypothetical protein EYG73_02515 [Arcobacter sp.]|nr:hypothetical protein [Arcobacter sp.]